MFAGGAGGDVLRYSLCCEAGDGEMYLLAVTEMKRSMLVGMLEAMYEKFCLPKMFGCVGGAVDGGCDALYATPYAVGYGV